MRCVLSSEEHSEVEGLCAYVVSEDKCASKCMKRSGIYMFVEMVSFLRLVCLGLIW